MQPVLALELSADGILLHELSYDGVWRRIAAASLNDPFLPKKMSAMRQAARASQGRFFKNQVWIPSEQFKTLEAKLTAEPEDRQAEAEEIVRATPGFQDGEYIVHFGEEDANGNSKIAAIQKSVLREANRFASGYGFGSDGFTSTDRIDGFYKQPYFTIAAPAKIAVDYGKIGFFAGLGLTIAAVVASGFWAFNNIDFTRDPSTAIEAVEERILEVDEDPRAPIRPTDIAQIPSRETPDTITGGADLGPLPEHDASITEFEAQVELSTLNSAIDIGDTPETSTPLDQINAALQTPTAIVASVADELPAPETTGFPVVASKALEFANSNSATDFEGGGAITRYTAIEPAAPYVSSPRLTDVLPRDDSTVVLSAQLRKYNESLGLTQVRENNAALVQMALTAEAQLVPPRIISGRPKILPAMRDGTAVPDALPAPVVIEPEVVDPDAEPDVLFTAVVAGLSVEQLQRIPPRIIEGRPPITPTLRDGVEVGAITEVVTPPEPVDPVAEANRIAALQAVPPNVLTGRPAVLPILREGTEITGGSGVIAEEPEPVLTEAQRLRPAFRPESIELTALVASLSEQAVPNALAPLHRSPGFAAKVEAMAEEIAEQARVTPTFTDAPRQVDVPTSANVANTATIEDGINLRSTSLIGVFGTPGSYRALLRKSGGKYEMLGVGDKIDGWTIVAISESSVRLKKGGKTKTLELPAEG